MPSLGLLQGGLELGLEGVGPAAGEGSGSDEVVDVLDQELDLLGGGAVGPED